MQMRFLSAEDRQLAREQALQRLQDGDSPDGLHHWIEDHGLSSPITLKEYQQGGYISVYYTLSQWAAA
jgi:hypothetical protein